MIQWRTTPNYSKMRFANVQDMKIKVVLLCMVLVCVCAMEVQVWMCLETCNATAPEISQRLDQLTRIAPYIDAVSYERYRLGEGGKLTQFDNTDINPYIHNLKLKSIPMVSSYPYPPEFLSWMRQVFQHPEPFIDDLLLAAKENHYHGFNIDWEPTVHATAQDALDYAAFLGHLGTTLHAKGLTLSVDVATWNSIWNITALATQPIDRIITMATYTANPTTWAKHFQYYVDNVPVERLGIGLMAVNVNTNRNYTLSTLKERMAAMEQAGIQSMSIWKLPLGEDFVTLLTHLP